MPISISKLPEVTNVKDNSFMLITQDGTTKRTMCDQFVTEEEARLDEFSPTVITSKSMSKTGEGDNVDYSSSAYDAPMKDVVLKGKTMVNCIQEPSSQDVVLPYEFEDGQYVTINDTKESGALGVELKGQTLVNLAKVRTATAYNKCSEKNIAIKPNTKYIALFNPTYYEAESGTNYALILVSSVSLNDTVVAGDDAYSKSVSNGLGSEYKPQKGDKHLIFTSNNNETYLHIRTGGNNGILYTDMMVLEYQDGMENWDIPYFEGMTSCKMPILSTVGKNLFNYKNYNLKVNEGQNPQEIIVDEQGLSFNVDTASWKSLWYDLYLESGEKYTLSYNTNLLRCFIFKSKVNTYVSSELVADTTVTNATEDKIQKVTKTFTAPSTGFIRVRLVSEQKVGNHILQNFQIEKSSSVTTYEPHKSSILSTNEDLELRGIGDVQDILDLNTGKLTSYYGERIVTEDDSFSTTLLDGKCTCIVGNMTDKISSYASDNFLADKVPHGAPANTDFGIYQNLGNFVIYETGDDLEAFKSKVIGTKIYYRLAEPVNKAVDLKVVDQNGNVIPTLKSWNTTTHIYSEIPENSLYPILSHSNPTYPVILKPSTKYSIVANSYSNDHTNSAINFNLGGATASTTVGNRVTTITTPSTLSNELLTMNGRGNKLNNMMVIEGDVMGDEPYFEGICDCKSPILSNVGKNLFNIDGDINQTYNGWYAPHKNMLCDVNTILINAYSHSNKGSGQIINVRPNTNYRVWYGQTGKCRVMISDSQGNQLGMQDLYGATEYTKIDFNSSQNTNVLLHFTTLGDSSVGKATVKNIFFGERTENFVYEPYKSNILSCNGDKIELTEDMFEQGGTIATVGVLYQNNKESNNTRLRLKDILEVAPNTTYRLKLAHGYEGYVQTYNREKLSTSNRLAWNNDIVFTTANNEQYVVVAIRNSSNSSISTSVLTSNIVTLSEVDKTIVLRSLPSGVCDTLNVETGEYVQRIGEVVKNNSTGFSLSTGGWENKTKVCTFEYFNPEGMKVQNANNKPTLNCDKVPSNTFADQWGNINGIESITQHSIGGIVLSITRDKLLTQDVNGLNTYLQSNPLTIQYELAEPIVTTIDAQGFPYAYKDGHVQLSSGHSGQSLTPKVEYNIATNRGGQITQNTKSLIRQGKLLNDIESKINQIIEATINNSIMLMKLGNK